MLNYSAINFIYTLKNIYYIYIYNYIYKSLCSCWRVEIGSKLVKSKSMGKQYHIAISGHVHVPLFMTVETIINILTWSVH